MKLLPGSRSVRVDHSKKHKTIDLYIDEPPTQAHIEDGMFYILVDSRKLAKDYMEKNEEMTKNLQYAQEICDDSFQELMDGWINGTLDCSEDSRAPEKGPKDWSPLATRFRPRGTLDTVGNTYNYDGSQWQGEVYEYATFRMPDGKRAFAVFWHLGGDPRGNYDAPEVWVGNVEAFLEAQWMDTNSDDVLDELDEQFDGGLVWAVEQLDLLGPEAETPYELKSLIEERPQLLSDKTLKDIKKHPNDYADWVRSVVNLL